MGYSHVQEGWQRLPSNGGLSGGHPSPVTFQSMCGEEIGLRRGSETSGRCQLGDQPKGRSADTQPGKPALLCQGIQGSALAEFALPKNEGLAFSTEMNPYGNLVSDATLRRRFLFPITLLISARKINRGEKAIGSKNISELLEELRVCHLSVGNPPRWVTLTQRPCSSAESGGRD